RGAPRGVISRNESAECRSRRTFLHETINRNISVFQLSGRSLADRGEVDSVERLADRETASEEAEADQYELQGTFCVAPFPSERSLVGKLQSFQTAAAVRA
ncbi:hypothetical protein, partial [Deinococcus alpinitundrae]|uniref:hypothetical protein n=1 Tax=Deinococcus alpinitundrae TaxID=468913 RepID=UPI001ED8F38A